MNGRRINYKTIKGILAVLFFLFCAVHDTGFWSDKTLSGLTELSLVTISDQMSTAI